MKCTANQLVGWIGYRDMSTMAISELDRWPQRRLCFTTRALPWRIPAAALPPDARKREFAIRFAKNAQTVPQQAGELALRRQLPTTGRGGPNCGDVLTTNHPIVRTAAAAVSSSQISTEARRARRTAAITALLFFPPEATTTVGKRARSAIGGARARRLNG